MTMKAAVTWIALILIVAQAPSQTPYKLPPKVVVDILDSPPTPIVRVSPVRDAMLFVDYKPQPPIEMLARPFLRLGGIRISPDLKCRQRVRRYTHVSVQWISSRKTVDIALPEGANFGVPTWSNDGKLLAFTRDVSDGVELWIADAATGTARAIPGVRLNDVLGSPFAWMSDNIHLLVHTLADASSPAPVAPKVPFGPIVEETSGKISKVATYQDLLKNPFDEELFEYYATCRLVIVDAKTGNLQRLGDAGMYLESSFSPDNNYLLITKLGRPFSYRVPYYYFTRSTEVWTRDAKLVATLAQLPVSDEIPTQGVPSGPREVMWQPLHGAKLVWVEALDGGDPMKKAPHRDKLMTLAAPFTGIPTALLNIQYRFDGIDWTARRDEVLLSEFDRDRRWQTTSFINLSQPQTPRKVVFDLSVNDAYKNPGQPVYETKPNGETVLAQEGDWIYFAARGASAEGDRPRLDRLNLGTLNKETLFLSREKAYEQFITFLGPGTRTILTEFESQKDPPNYFSLDLKGGSRIPLTAFPDPAPELTGVKKELIKYNRADGVALSGTLYLPPSYVPGTRLPVLIWAYPLEYSDPSTAGQVRGSPYTFTFFRGASPLFFLTQGYAVLMDATMPVVGDPETMNNTFIEQIVGAAKAAIDKLDSLGVADRKRVCVTGHSYGAFMTANLLAHSDLFAAGIARSGAYNRSLTPFGFQSERRSFWEATDVYMKVSPFTFANKIIRPLLLIHGEADNNPGTFTMQSERLYQAIKGNGGTARLVLLPFESHGYAARESVLHTLAEMFEWADKYVKNKK